jgi:uncharacterized phage infection (PIP) family protein YhgE
MSIADDYTEMAERFGSIAKKYCDIIDSSSKLEKPELLTRIYEVLPALIDAAVHLPDAGTLVGDADDEENEDPADAHQKLFGEADARHKLYRLLHEKLGDSDSYRLVFNAAKDKEAISASLADDISDIYQDLRGGLVLMEKNPASPQDALWEWRFGFDSHWGHHATSALKTIHDIRHR